MSEIINKENAPFYHWGSNCSSWLLQDNAQLSLKLEIMPAGTKEQWHMHEIANQFFYILKGQATFYLESEIIILNPSDGLNIPNLQKHYIANECNEEIEFLVISQPNTTNDRINL